LGVMTAETLEEAIAIQNEIEYGLTAGLHSLDSAEMGVWLDTIQAGNLYVNRGITGAIVQRQPFGGWKKSAVGAGTKAGGPNYLIGLGSWLPAEAKAKRGTVLQGAAAQLLSAAKSADVTAEELQTLQQSLFSDAAAWESEFGTAKDVSALTAERNVFRYRSLPVTIRLSEGERLADLLRVVAAGAVAGSKLTVSSAVVLPDAVVTVFANLGVSVRIEDDAAWLARAAQFDAGRIRLIGGDFAALSAAMGGRPDVAVYHGVVTQAGRIEMLPFLREQAVSITAHRFGTPNHLSDHLI
jgi:RHH-type proline utilization regulon transcriptional repressor/proline dehydrogenase/delta 1-pyrroline-5-carboxylate dehydrogenase